VLKTQRREDFARSLCDEVRVLKVRMGRNRARCFLGGGGGGGLCRGWSERGNQAS
jgi:hypothetical protein